MFSWLQPDSQGLARIAEQFGQMLAEGQSLFEEASRTFLEGRDPQAVSDDLHARDRQINRLEQTIRRELVVHLTVGQGADAHECLRMMSLVKDAERVGDYAKNIFNLTVAPPGFDQDPLHAVLAGLVPRLSGMFTRVRELYAAQDEEGARAYCEEADALRRELDGHVEALIKDPAGCSHPVAAALLFRYDKRTLAHTSNVASAIYMPLDKLDYLDEDEQDR